MENLDLILSDAVTYVKINKNENYKERLLEAYYLLVENGIDGYDKFQNCNLGIGAFKYEEITIFERLKNENYSRALASFNIELKGTNNLSKDYGDVLASWGTVGKTPYRAELIKNGYITTGLTEEETNKYYR